MPFGDWFRGPRRLRVAVALSVAVHLLLFIGLGVLVKVPLFNKETARKGDTLIVDLQNPEAPAPLGNPAARAPAPPGPPGPASPPARQSSRPSPPATAKSAPSRPAPPPEAKPAPPVPAPPKPEPPTVARATPSEPEPREAPRPPEPPAKPSPAAQPSEEPARPAPETSHAPPTQERPPAPREETHVAVATPGDGKPSTGSKPGVDIRSALRGGGGGAVGSSTGRPGGRGGIEGEPIPLDSKDPRFTDFLERVKRAIYANWGFPCVRNNVTRECEYKDAQLIVEFGILKSGRLQFVDLRDSSGLSIYDDYALNAIKLAAPFPEVPPQMLMAMRQGSTGVAILARFTYNVHTSISNVLR